MTHSISTSVDFLLFLLPNQMAHSVSTSGRDWTLNDVEAAILNETAQLDDLLREILCGGDKQDEGDGARYIYRK